MSGLEITSVVHVNSGEKAISLSSKFAVLTSACCRYGGMFCENMLLNLYTDTSAILSGGCPGNCSGHGACQNGKCML